MITITDSFMRTLQFRLDECSTFAQFSEFFVKNKSMLYNSESYKMFVTRLNSIKNNYSDNMIRRMCDDLLEDLEEEHGITSTSSGKGSLPILLQFNTEEGNVLNDGITEILKSVFIRARGKKKEVSRILGISTEALDSMIDSDKIRKKVILEAKKAFKVLKD
jgi:hypothetical protein